MSEKTEFFCPCCNRFKPLALRGTRKMGNHIQCIPCAVKLAEKMKPKVCKTAAGVTFSITAEALRNSRIHTANKKSKETASYIGDKYAYA